MNNILIILLLTLVQLLAGFGVLTIFKIYLKPALYFALALLMGIVVFSFVPFVLQLFYIPITPSIVYLALLIATLLLNLQYKAGIRNVKAIFAGVQFRISIYELPVLLMIGFIIFVSVWRCYYYPPTPNDVTTGAEAIAEYTVREKTMINSVFAVSQNGNTLKPPFITCLQIIYKFAGFPFGQVWLCSVFISFTIILYHILSIHLHRVIAGLLLIFLLAIPEMYAYTFMILYDYSNAVFFFLSVFFCITYFKEQQLKDLAFAGFLIGIATYIRPETLLLAAGVMPLILINAIKNKIGFKELVRNTFIFLLPTVIIYFTAVYIYIHYYLPGGYSIAAQVNSDITNMRSVIAKFTDTNKTLIFSSQGIIYYSYFIFIFLAFLIAELIYKRKLNIDNRNYLYCVFLVYLVFPLLSHVLPGVSIDYTVKRAFIKLFPLMLLFIANCSLLTDLSKRISRWENNTNNPQLEEK